MYGKKVQNVSLHYCTGLQIIVRTCRYLYRHLKYRHIGTFFNIWEISAISAYRQSPISAYRHIGTPLNNSPKIHKVSMDFEEACVPKIMSSHVAGVLITKTGWQCVSIIIIYITFMQCSDSLHNTCSVGAHFPINMINQANGSTIKATLSIFLVKDPSDVKKSGSTRKKIRLFLLFFFLLTPPKIPCRDPLTKEYTECRLRIIERPK